MAELEVTVIGEHLCPRRSEGVPAFAKDTKDKWVVRNDPKHPHLMNTGFSSCTYCGSIHPDDFLQKVREGWIVGPTDKSYKVYLSSARTPEELEQEKRRWLQGPLAQILIANGADAEAEWEKEYRPLAESDGGSQAKFYFQHLSADQRREFIELYNDKKMRVGYPGHFYVHPYFTRST